jgi:hypothetical protein
MFIAQAIDTPQMLRDVGLAAPSKPRMTCERSACRYFPSRFDLKTVAERCCILSGITARGNFAHAQ